MVFCEGWQAQRATLHNLFPPFRTRRLVIDRRSNAERGSGGEVEIILNDQARLSVGKSQKDNLSPWVRYPENPCLIRR